MNISKNELRKLYIDERLTIRQISDKLGVPLASVCRKLKKYGIQDHKKLLSKELLIDLYINQNKSIDEIGDEIGASKITIAKWLKTCGIPTDPKLREIPSRESLNELYVVQCKTLDEMETILGINRNLISKWLKKYGIKIRIFGRTIEAPTKELLERLYLEEKFTIKQISRLYNTNDAMVRDWFVGYSIPIKSSQRKFYHLRAIPLSNLQRELMVGTLLGKGDLQCIGKKKSIRLVTDHGENQLDYLLYKKELMNAYVNTVNRYVDKKRDSIRWYWASIFHNDFKFYHKLFYDNNIKIIKEELGRYLTPFGMAIWVMDDGWKNHDYNIRISSEKFSKKENEILARIIKLNFNLRCKVCEYTRNNIKYYYLSFNKENSIKLTNLIGSFALPSMRYKLIENRSSTTTCQTSLVDGDIV